jgi:LAO/AO transport system kinase
LIESNHPAHRAQAQQLLEALAREKKRGKAEREGKGEEEQQQAQADSSDLTPEQQQEAHLRKKRPLRIGISGPPGVGKSTFIECLGRFLLSHGHRLAVLSIDPSSHVTGGSILGDKTRMLELSRHPDAYVRPSPSKCVLGGVGSNTFDTILLCEYAGFDLVVVETVGVGQSEVSVADMVDLLIMLVQPGGGDELQGMKKGRNRHRQTASAEKEAETRAGSVCLLHALTHSALTLFPLLFSPSPL